LDNSAIVAAVVEPGLLASAILAVALALMHASSNSKPTTLSNSASGLPLLIAHMHQRGAPLHRGVVAITIGLLPVANGVPGILTSCPVVEVMV
jgi:hypothetical protein